MSILRSLNTGASGLRAHGQAMGTTSDNIANVSTVGFKRSRAVFQDVLGRSINANVGSMPMAGAGSQVSHIQQMWAQGALLTTDAPTDLALSGEGFFVVDGNLGGMDGRFFTRAGQFRINEAGNLVNPDGLRLQGYETLPTGELSGTLSDLTIANQSLPATATGQVDLSVQLDSNEPVPAAAFDPLNPEGTSNFSTGVTIYDSLGNPQEITVYYRNNGGGSWEWHALTDGGNVTGGTAGTAFEGASGTLSFTTNGELDVETPGPSTWDFVDATPGQAIVFDFGDAITTDGGTGLQGSTGFASPTTTNGQSQDGFGAGTVSGISVAGDGTITGVFSNGQRRDLGQVAVADFASIDGLQRGGKGTWVSTQASGDAIIAGAATGGRGSIVSGALEQSNVDIGQEFVDLIGYQRGFQASSRVITTADEMYGELVNLKR